MKVFLLSIFLFAAFNCGETRWVSGFGLEKSRNLRFEKLASFITGPGIKNIFINKYYETITFTTDQARSYCESMKLDLFRPETSIEISQVGIYLNQRLTDDNEVLIGQQEKPNSEEETFEIKVQSESDSESCAILVRDEFETWSQKQVSCSQRQKIILCEENISFDTKTDFLYNDYFETSDDSDEVSQKLSDPETTTTTEKIPEPETTTEAPHKCDQQRDIYDSQGNYIKTACAVFMAKSRDDSCVDDGMNLFVIDSVEAQTSVLDFATSMFGRGGGSLLNVNGKQDQDGNWFTYGPEKQPLMRGIRGITDKDDSDDLSRGKRSAGLFSIYQVVAEAALNKDFNESEEWIDYEETFDGTIDDDNDDVIRSSTDSSHVSDEDDSDSFYEEADYDSSEYFEESTELTTTYRPIIDPKCLVLTAFGDFKVDTWRCSAQSYSICEYKKNVPKFTTTIAPPTTTTEEVDEVSEDVRQNSVFETDDLLTMEVNVLDWS